MLKRIGASQIELAELLNPHTYEIMMHPFTARILEKHPKFGEILANIAAVEKVNKLSGMDADEKLIDLGIISASRETLERERKRKREANENES